MKKLIYVLSILLLSFGLVACNSNKDVLVLPENIEKIKIEAVSTTPDTYLPLEITKENNKYNDLILWFNELELTKVDEDIIDGIVGGTDYKFTINNSNFYYIDGGGHYIENKGELFEVNIPMPLSLDDFTIDE